MKTKIIKYVSGIIAITSFVLVSFRGTAQFGTALSFKKANSQYVTVPHSSSINLGATFTMEAVVNYTGINSTIVDKGNYDFLWQLGANANGSKMGFYTVASGWIYSTADVRQLISTHVAVVGSGGTVTFYINGVAAGSGSATAKQDNNAMTIGRQQPSLGGCQCNHMNGSTDELRIWNVARTQAQIQEGMNTTVPTNSAGLVAYYKFDEGSGTTTADATSNGNNGTLINGPTWVTSNIKYGSPGTFSYTVPPQGVGLVRFQAWGAGASANNSCTGYSGGGAAFSQSKYIAVSAGQSISLKVGTAGGASVNGEESYVTVAGVKKLGANGGTVRYGAVASTVATYPDLDFSYKGGDAGNNISGNGNNLFGGAGAAGDSVGPGGNGSNAQLYEGGVYFPALGGTSSAGGKGGGNGAGLSSNSCLPFMFSLDQNAQSTGSGGGAPYGTIDGAVVGAALGGQIIMSTMPCPAAGSISPSHTVPYPAELADTLRSVVDGTTAGLGYTWQSSPNGTSNWTTIADATQAYYAIPDNPTPPNEIYYRRLNICGIASNITLIKTFTQANKLLDGTIEGKVQSSNGTGVDGITVTAQKTINLLGSPITKTYSVVTTNGGQFSLQNIFYGDVANGDPASVQFKVSASKPGHVFSPAVFANLTNTNHLVQNLLLTDSTVYSLTGTVIQNCPTCETGFTTADIDSVKVSASKGATTFAVSYSGDNGPSGYGITLTDPGQYSLVPSFKNHTFTPVSQSVNIVNDDISGINFVDNTSRAISGNLHAGCNEVIGSAQLEFTDTVAGRSGFQFKKLVNTDANGGYSTTLPARKYRVRLLSFTPSGSDPIPVGEVLTFFNTTIKDSMLVDIDTIARAFDLTYHRAPVLQIENLLDTTFAPYTLFRQGKPKTFIVNVFEGNPSHGCKVATDTTKRMTLTTSVQVDDISEVFKIGQVNGADTITLVGGQPNIVGPDPAIPGSMGYLKYFNVTYTDKFNRPASPITRNVVVLGVKNDPGTFTTVSPQIPLMILHHPPGDQSYSYWKADQSNETAMRFYSGKTDANGGFIEAKLGTKFMLGFVYLTEVSIWGTLNFAQNVSAKVNDATEAIITTTNSTAYSTAQNSGLGGSDGDVYIGTALNLLYARAHELKFVSDQTLGIEDKLGVAENGFATNYIYSEAQIKNVVIPTLQEIIDNPTVDQAVRDKNKNQVNVWQQVLANNAANKARAAFDANYTFDGGDGAIDRSTTTTASKSNTIEFTMEVDRNFAVGLGLEIAGIGVSGGFNVNMKLETGNSTTTTSTNSTTIGYVLDDDDLYDSYTVDVKKDPVYNTPVFSMVAGTTSCPPETPGQSRDAVQISVAQPVQTNVPANSEATFNIVVSNISESNETRDYNLSFDAGTANGAIVTIAGAPAAGLVVPLPDIAYLGSRTVTVKVRKDPGNNVFSYENLKFTAYDACAGGVSKSTNISAYFASPCSDITLAAPLNNWVAGSGNNNLLPVQISGYTLANLQTIELQHTNAGSSNWVTDTTLFQALIASAASTTINWNLAKIADGNYDLRLKLVCASGTVYSQRVTGIVDRRAPIVFGIPEPTDNSYVAGDIISVSYNEAVNTTNLGSSQVKLRRVSDNTLIPIQVSGYQNKIIITPINPITSMTGEELELIVSNVADIYGNVQILGDSSRFVVGTTVAAVGANAINLSSVKSSQLENFSDSMDIRFTVTSPATNDRLINFTISGTATYNEDYTVRFPAGQPVTSTFNGSQGKISILANTTQAILRIKPIKDNISEPDETVTITLAEGGNYLLGAVYTKTDTIKNDDLSNPVVIKNGPTNICAGQSLTLSTNSTIDGQPVYSYYWDNGTFNSGDQTVNITSPGTYTLTVYTANGFSGVSDPIVVTISPLAAPSIGPDVTVIKNCFEETTNLLSLFNTTGLTSTWNTQNTTMAPPGTYQLVAANSGGCTDTAYAYVKLDVATWTGSQSSDWNTPANWNTNKVPTSTMHVIIPGGTANPCVVGSADVTVASIQVRNGGILQTINNRKINVAGKCLTLPPSPGFKLSK